MSNQNMIMNNQSMIMNNPNNMINNLNNMINNPNNMMINNPNNIINNPNNMMINNPNNMINNNNNYPMNMGMPNMMNMGMNNMMGLPIGSGMGIMFNNMNDEDEEWLKGFKMADEEVNNYNDTGPGPKKNVIFQTTKRDCHILVVNYGVTIDELLKRYLKRIGRPELIGDKSNKIRFLYNTEELKFGDKTTIEKCFKNALNPKVVVYEMINFI